MRAAALLASFLLVACGGAQVPRAPSERIFHLAPLSDLVATPRLQWLVQAEPRTLYALPSLAVALEELVSSPRMAAFARTHGGLDPRALHEIAYARYEAPPGHAAGTLLLGRGFLPSSAIETATLAALPYVRQHSRDPSGLIRIEGRADNHVVDVLLFGHQGILQAEDAGLAARAARAFAEQRLKRTQPALRSGALAEAQAALGRAPLRVFAARPDVSFARDGLFEHFEALALAILPSESQGVLSLTVRVLAVGAFAGRELEVEAALRRRLDRLQSSRMGALLGFKDAPAWTVQASGRTVIAERRVQGAAFLHGLHLATGADTAELFAAP